MVNKKQQQHSQKDSTGIVESLQKMLPPLPIGCLS